MKRFKEFLRNIAKEYLDAHVRTKMLLLFSVILLITVALTGSAYQQIYNIILNQRVSDMSDRTLAAIGNSMDTLINMENSYSKVILADNNIQKALNDPRGLLELSRTRNVNTVLTGQLEINAVASSVYVIDNEGNRYGVDERGLKPINIINSDITTLSWYREAANRRGGYLLVKNGGGVFLEQPKEDFISLIRIINNLHNFQPIGILMLNIPVSSLADACLSGSNAGDVSIVVSDTKGEIILEALQGGLYEKSHTEKLRQALAGGTGGSVKVDNTEYMLSRVQMKSAPWQISSAMPKRTIGQDTSVFAVISLVLLVIVSLLLFFGVLFISDYITRPLDKLLTSMDSVEQGVFEKVEFPVGDDEIGQLQRRYNIMVEHIGVLFQRTIEEQKLTHKAELNLLQAQIKPHFLYNTLDSIRSLSLTKDNRRVYYTVTALENYYRACLSSGREVVTIADEVKSVKNYLRVQRIRYGGLFRAIYSIDEELAAIPILKLVLQPLVENSLYHGIKPKGKNGVIHISVQQQNHAICLAVEDNGIGMTQENAEKLLLQEGSESFGLRGTRERLRIFYEGQSSVSITSIPGVGTRIELMIPIEIKGEEQNGK